ncbi:Uncharacterized protein M6B38_220625 [Iris pallida]|uniref:Uncharacterized protein n=1 Tax=Iris pallida TaxID=29817 RepID=A0AAX6DYP2_IRIPA|nr:Uncharacterized protein M6B38_220625 [Iris pallida]
MNKKMTKLKTLLHLTVCRLAILKNQHKARCNHARDDLLQLLQLGHRDRALLRAELVVKEENMLDVFAMLEGYCHLLTERSVLLRGQKECPDELREAASSLVYTSSRLGDLPELYHVRNVFSSMFGKDFTNSAVEIRNCCGVNPKIVQKLSTRQPSLETRVRITKEIAAAKGITLDLVYDNSTNHPDTEHETAKEIVKPTMQADPSSTPKRTGSSGRATYKYKDAVSAALAAFESAEDAAAAAKAAVELSRSSQSSSGDHHQSGSDCSSPGKEDKIDSDKVKDDPVHDSSTSESDEEVYYPHVPGEINKNKSSSTSESEEEDDAVEYFSSARRLHSNEHRQVEKHESKNTSESDDKNMSFRSSKRSPYAFTGSPLHEQEEEEGTFELASEKSESDTEEPSHRRRVFNAAPGLGSPDNPIYQKSNYATKNRWARHSVSYSSEARTFHSEVGQEKSADILPTTTRRALSVRMRRGLQR